jgi:uracil-DNA glycosylase family protein
MPRSAPAKEYPPAPVPPVHSLQVLREAARGCTACDLYEEATQTVFGEGPSHARVFAVGEQPGDQEDKQGHPFVGPAGKLLNRAIEAAGISPEDVYVTNAVKHFKFEERGKRRIHQKPNTFEIQACRPWLEAEVEAVKPELILCLGATAAQSVFGRKVPINENRGKFLPHPWAKHAFITTHPSAILRVDPEDREREFGRLVDDLRAIGSFLRARRTA